MVPTFDPVSAVQALESAPSVAGNNAPNIQVADLALQPPGQVSAQDAAAFSRAIQVQDQVPGVAAPTDVQAALPPSADSLSSRLAKQADALSHRLSSMQAQLSPAPDSTQTGPAADQGASAGNPALMDSHKAEIDGAVAQMEHAYMFAIETTMASHGSTESTKIFNTLLKGQ